MNATLARIGADARSWWQQREPRERAMLGLMCAAVAAFVLWYGALVPLRQARDAAQARHFRAVAELARVQAELAGIAALEQRLPAAPANVEGLEQAVRTSAASAGLALDHARTEAGGFAIESEAASPAQLFAWLDALRQQHGLAPATLSVARNQEHLRVQARFEPIPP